MFERLCRDGVPTGPDIFEITRLCLPPTEPKTERRRLRDGLIHAMVAHGLEHGIHQFTGVVTARFRERIMAMGWEGEALGQAIDMGGGRLGGLRGTYDETTPAPLVAKEHQPLAART